MSEKKYKTIKITVEEDFYNEIQATAEATGIGEDFTRAALGRLVKEYKRNGQVLLGDPVVMSRKVAEAFTTNAENSVTIQLTPIQKQVMVEAAKKFELTIEQACKYSLFHFDFIIDPSAGDGWSAVQELLQAQQPDRAFQDRYEDEIKALTQVVEEAPNQGDEAA